MKSFKNYCPTLKEIKSRKIKDLAERLVGRNDEITLSNILEWQSKNIKFWQERWPVVPVFIALVGFFAISLLIYIDSPVNTTSFLLWPITIFASGAVAIFITIILILRNRKIPLMEGLVSMFKPSIPLDIFLKNKLGVCRDYAKLNACLLSNLYPDSEIYFAHAPGHVAAGVKVKNRIYMLDQSLPVLTFEGWSNLQHVTKLEKFAENQLVKVKKKEMGVPKGIKLNKKKLAIKIATLLNVKRKNTRAKSFPVKLPNGSLYYEDNKIVNYSLARTIKMKISSEFYGKTKKIIKITIKQDGKNLIFYCTVC